jgi:hypothetical protein
LGDSLLSDSTEGGSHGVIVLVHLFLLVLSFPSQTSDFKFSLLTPYNYNTWHQNAWNALMKQGYTYYVEKKVIEPRNDKEKVL